MITNKVEMEFSSGLIDDSALFSSLFSPAILEDVYFSRFAKSTGKGVDRLNGPQYASRAPADLAKVSEKCLDGSYRFSSYLENLKTKGRNKPPRVIGIPTIRDRVVLHQLNRYLAFLYPERVPKNIASTYIRQITEDLKTKPIEHTSVCSTDIKTFYDSIKPDRLLAVLRHRVKCWQALRLLSIT
jgi:RNA-directed DNA polymerase